MEPTERYVARYRLDRIFSPDLLASLRPRRFGPGEIIIRSGDPVDEVLFFVDGRAKAYSTMDNGQRVLASFYLPFDAFGEAELFSSERYALTIEAMAESACLCLSADALIRAAPRNHRLLAYLCGRLGAKLNDRFAAESINLRYPVERRLASYLLAAGDDGGIIAADDLGDLADYIGCSYRQLSRVVRDFRARGILAGGRGRLVVADRAALEPFAGDLYTRSASLPPSARAARPFGGSERFDER